MTWGCWQRVGRHGSTSGSKGSNLVKGHGAGGRNETNSLSLCPARSCKFGNSFGGVSGWANETNFTCYFMIAVIEPSPLTNSPVRGGCNGTSCLEGSCVSACLGTKLCKGGCERFAQRLHRDLLRHAANEPDFRLVTEIWRVRKRLNSSRVEYRRTYAWTKVTLYINWHGPALRC